MAGIEKYYEITEVYNCFSTIKAINTIYSPATS